MNTLSNQQLQSAKLSASSTEIMRLIVTNACPDATIERICSLVDDFRENAQATFVEHGMNGKRQAIADAKSHLHIPIRNGDKQVVGDLRVVSSGESDAADTDCDVIRHVVHLIELVIARRDDRASLRKERERACVAMRKTVDAVITTDAQGVIDYINPMAEDLLQCNAREVVGSRAADVIRWGDSHSDEVIADPVSLCMRSGRTVTVGQNALLGCCGTKAIAVHGSVSPLWDDGTVTGSVFVFHDVSSFARVARQLAYQASHDPLTGLANRAEFERLLISCVDARDTEAAACALLQIDIDQLKVINDTHGHVVGDELLRQVAEVIENHVTSTDTVARLSGDEFGVLVRCQDENKTMQTAEEIRAAVERHRFSWRGVRANVRCSIGVVMLDRGDNVTELLAAADVACYSAKKMGRNQIYVYSNGGGAPHHEEMKWVSRITGALDEDRFELFCQPVIRLREDTGGNRDHCEILLRLRDEEGRLVPPSKFIPAAEHYSLMPQLDRWVIRNVCAHHADRGTTDPSYTLNVNLSGRSLSEDQFPAFVVREIEKHGLPPGAICFEITETAAISDISRAVMFINTLRELGCLFALDDFGSGLSSFAYLKRLPVDYLKIDGHFIRNMLSDEVDMCTVMAISQVARSAGIQTVAEKVETREVLERLREIGVDYAQGFHIARPRPITGLREQMGAAARSSYGT